MFGTVLLLLLLLALYWRRHGGARPLRRLPLLLYACSRKWLLFHTLVLSSGASWSCSTAGPAAAVACAGIQQSTLLLAASMLSTTAATAVAAAACTGLHTAARLCCDLQV